MPPQAALPEETKLAFYEQLASLLSPSHPTLIGGDFNVRLHPSANALTGIGPFSLRLPQSHTHTDDTQANQNLFLTFLAATDFSAANTYFQKSLHKLTTYEDPISHVPLQLDFLLIHQNWKMVFST